MASIEGKTLAAFKAEMERHATVSMQSPMSGEETSIAYSAGYRQGVYEGLGRAMKIIAALLEDKAKKDDLL